MSILISGLGVVVDHAIIGLSQTGAACLAYIQQLCLGLPPGGERFLENLYYIQGHGAAIKNLPFVPEKQCISFKENTLPEIHARHEQLLQKYGDAKSNHQAAALAGSRRLAAARFRHDGALLEDALRKFVKKAEPNRTALHIVVDASSPLDSGVLSELLAMLGRIGSDAEIFVYFFHSQKGLSEYQAASLYAALLECGTQVITSRLTFCDFPFDQQSLSIKQQTCAHQIFHALITTTLTAGLADEPRENILADGFYQIQELAVSINRHKMRQALAWQMTAKFIQFMLDGGGSSEEKVMPAWIGQLFSDKKWLLHPSFLSMEQDIFDAGAGGGHDSVEREWESRIRFFLEKVNEESEYDVQLNEISAALDDVYRKRFRGKGVNLFYTINESGIAALAQKIVGQFDEELTKTWSEGQYTLVEILTVCKKITAAIENQLSVCQNRRQQQGDLAKGLLSRHQDLMSDWESSGRAKRRAIQKEYPVQNAAYQLMNYYVADCHSKAMTFACRLLLSVIGKMDELQNNIHQLGKNLSDHVAKIQGNHAVINRERVLSSDDEEIWKLSSEMNWLDLMPAGFTRSLVKLYEDLRIACINSIIKPEEGFVGVPKRLDTDDGFTGNVCNEVIVRHPVFRPDRFISVENLFFWQLIAKSQAQIQNTVQKMTSTKPSASGIKQTLLLPPNPSGKGIPAELGTLLEKIPNCHTLINVGMSFPCLLYRQLSLIPVKGWQGFSEWEAAYDRLQFSGGGAVNSLLLHTQNDSPYPEYENILLTAPKPDDVRYALLLGEIRQVVHVVQADDGTMTTLLKIGGTHIPLGSHLPDVQKHMTPSRFKLLSYALDHAENQAFTDQMANMLNARLENIKTICLNGKSDVRQASWTEAGDYMPWVRAGERVAKQ